MHGFFGGRGGGVRRLTGFWDFGHYKRLVKQGRGFFLSDEKVKRRS